MVPEMLAREDRELAAAFGRLNKLFDAARATMVDAKADATKRAAACALLGRRADTKAEELKLLAGLFTPQTPAEVQLGAIKAAARTGDASVPAVLLANWAGLSPGVRTAVADALLPRETWALELAKSPATKELDFARRERLRNHPSAKVKEAAKATLAQGAANADRQKVIDSYAAALTLAGDMQRGQAVYAEHCATCHKVGSAAVGHEIGPNLLTTREWTKENLLAAILDPDRTVEPRYLAYAATLADGTTLTGLVTNESGGSVTIKTLDDRDHAVPRGSLKSLASTGHSLMPAGFETAIDPQAMADLFAFIATPVPPR